MFAVHQDIDTGLDGVFIRNQVSPKKYAVGGLAVGYFHRLGFVTSNALPLGGGGFGPGDAYHDLGLLIRRAKGNAINLSKILIIIT